MVNVLQRPSCSFAECTEPHVGHGYCSGHYQQFKRGKPLTPLGSSRVDPSQPCAFEGCIRGQQTRSGYCKAHYQQISTGKELRPLRDTRPSLTAQDRRRRDKYGLMPEDYQRLLDQQGGGCALCGRSDCHLVVDHDHQCCPGQQTCGKCVRALLCDNCNMGLGHFRDDPDLMAKAIAYIRTFDIQRGDHHAGTDPAS